MHIRDLRHIRPMRVFKTAATIATSVVHSKLHYCNFLKFDSTENKANGAYPKLTCTRTITGTSNHHHITPTLNSLQRLKIPERIHFKFCQHSIYTSCSTPSPRAFVNFSPSSQNVLPDNPPVSPFPKPRSLLPSIPPRAICITAPRLPFELCTFSLRPPSLLITNHHLHPAPLSIIP